MCDNMSRYSHWDEGGSMRELAQDEVYVIMISDASDEVVAFAAFSLLPVGSCHPRAPLELALVTYIYVRFPFSRSSRLCTCWSCTSR